MEQAFEDEQSLTISDYVAIAKRRKKPIAITTGTVFAICLLAALFWPPTYRSTAVILIEEQDVPQDLVRSTVTSYALQRIEEIKQRIMTTGNIMSIAKRFALYSEKELDRLTRSEISHNFRSNVAVNPISADVIDPISGRPTEAVIAFQLSFDGSKTNTVHKVTNELVTLFLNENLKDRTEQSSSTSEFLSTEAKALDKQLKDLELDISEFKENNIGALPELTNHNLSILDRTQQELLNISTRLQELERRKIELRSGLAQLSPTSPQILASGEAVLSETDRLKALESELRFKSAKYHDHHPDLQRLKREIAAIKEFEGSDSKEATLVREIHSARNLLASLRDKYTEDHPEVIKLRILIEELKSQKGSILKEASKVIADNPAYVLIETQIHSIESEIVALKDKQKTLNDKINQYDSLLARAPAVEKDYQALLRNYENSQLKYQEIKAKQMSATLAQSLEQERKGERFTLIQPPEIPENPISPNRALLFFMGIVFASGLGAASGILAEKIDPKVYGEKAILAATNVAHMISIPYMEPEEEKTDQRKNYQRIAIGASAGIIMTIILFHNFVKPIDVAWFILLRKLGIHG